MLPSEIQGKRILYTVLNWGLGHASRSIPLIKQLSSQGNEVYIASDGLALALLQAELPSLNSRALAKLKIHYKRDSMALNMATQLPHLMNHYRLDLKEVKDFQQELNFDIVISDHRYGGLHPDCFNIFLGHQLSILKPDFSSHKMASMTNAKMINRFDEVWVPDSEDQSLSGKLSSNSLVNRPIRFIGPLSRFRPVKNIANVYEALAVLSGPEPKRTVLESRIIEKMRMTKGRFAIVTGSDNELINDIPNIDFFGIETAHKLQGLFDQSKRFIGRAGYSTIMDLAVLGLPCLLMPTNGQTEQMYLSAHIQDQLFQFCEEGSLNMRSVLSV